MMPLRDTLLPRLLPAGATLLLFRHADDAMPAHVYAKMLMFACRCCLSPLLMLRRHAMLPDAASATPCLILISDCLLFAVITLPPY